MNGNTLYTGDNLYILHGMDGETVDLIYLDPPFNSKRLYKAPVGSRAAGASFKDMWTWQDVDESYLDQLVEDYPYLVQFIQSVEVIHGKPMMAYLTYMTQRIIEMRRILKSTGSIYLHCDPYASHYLKILMDRIFGKNCFRNEIIWHYSGWNKRLTSHIERRHDALFFYSKTKSVRFNSPTRPWKDKHEYVKVRKQKVRKDDDDGREYVLSDAGGGKRVKRYLDEAMEYGVPLDNVWDIPKLNNSDAEKTGYPTQKPLKLLQRIIEVSSNEGDVVLDPFCGCATTCVAAQQLGRNWIGIDISEKAAELVVDRLSDEAGLFTDFIHLDRPPQRTDLEQCTPDQDAKTRLYADQNGQCNACGVEMDIRHFEIDHIIPRAKHGGDYYENYQLLCGHCNRTKGDRPMEYLRAKIRRRNETLRTRVSF